MTDDSGKAEIYRVEVWKQVDPRGIWKPVLIEKTSAYTELGAIKSVLETGTAKAQLELSRGSEPTTTKSGMTKYLEAGGWHDPE